MNKQEAFQILKDEVTEIKETFDKISSIEWCLMNGYFLENNPDKNLLNLYYTKYRNLFHVLDDYFMQMKQMFQELYNIEKL